MFRTDGYRSLIQDRGFDFTGTDGTRADIIIYFLFIEGLAQCHNAMF